MKKLIAPLMLIAVTLLVGCGADFLLPWLDESSVVPCNREWVGEWFLEEGGGKSKFRVVVEVREENVIMDGDRTLPEKYRITVYDRDGKRSASLVAHLHSINGVQLLQIQNFNRPTVDELTSVITYSLWRIEGDKDNLMLWIPGFVVDALKTKDETPVSIVRAGHELEQPVFVDSTEKLQAFIEDWTKTYEETETKLPLALHRKNKTFEIPPGVKKRG